MSPTELKMQPTIHFQKKEIFLVTHHSKSTEYKVAVLAQWPSRSSISGLSTKKITSTLNDE
jgi:hypothetical protein